VRTGVHYVLHRLLQKERLPAEKPARDHSNWMFPRAEALGEYNR